MNNDFFQQVLTFSQKKIVKILENYVFNSNLTKFAKILESESEMLVFSFE